MGDRVTDHTICCVLRNLVSASPALSVPGPDSHHRHASPIKPNLQSRDDVQWIELDRNYGHPNDIRVGSIHTKYSGFTRSVIMGAMYALSCDADFYVYVEQDALLFGDDFLMHALGDSTDDILLGPATQNGRGSAGARRADDAAKFNDCAPIRAGTLRHRAPRRAVERRRAIARGDNENKTPALRLHTDSLRPLPADRF